MPINAFEYAFQMFSRKLSKVFCTTLLVSAFLFSRINGEDGIILYGDEILLLLYGDEVHLQNNYMDSR